MAKKRSTMREVPGASWHAVSTRTERLGWITAILADEGVEVVASHESELIAIAYALLKHVANSEVEEVSHRTACFMAAMRLERFM